METTDNDYVELDLVHVKEFTGKEVWFAVGEETAENMLHSASDSSYLRNPALRFTADIIGKVRVQVKAVEEPYIT